jgi:hypothetical protein
MSFEEDYDAFLTKKADADAAFALAAAQEKHDKEEARIKWFNEYLPQRFPQEIFENERFVVDSRTQERVSPVKRFRIHEWEFFFYPESEGILILYGPNFRGNGAVNVGRLDASTKNDAISEMIGRHFSSLTS